MSVRFCLEVSGTYRLYFMTTFGIILSPVHVCFFQLLVLNVSLLFVLPPTDILISDFNAGWLEPAYQHGWWFRERKKAVRLKIIDMVKMSKVKNVVYTSKFTMEH